MFFLKKNLVDNDGLLSFPITDDKTKKVTDFYKITPFPNYKANDDKRSILDKGNKNILAQQFKKQIDVVENLAEQISGGNNSLRGLMLESHLVEGNQSITDNLVYGQSITDACMNWDDTLNCLQLISKAVQKRRG